jgi:hypothetical protein
MARLMRLFVVVVLLAIVGIGGWAAYTYVRHTNHQDACQRYGDALSTVLADPQSPVDHKELDQLTTSDRQTVTKGIAQFQSQLHPPGTQGTDPASIVASAQAAKSEPALISQWKAQANQFRNQALARQGC